METLIRKYEQKDLEDLKKCILELKKFESQFEPNTLLTNDAVDHLIGELTGEGTETFVALKDNELVGFISYKIEDKNVPEIFGDEKSVMVEAFSVLPSARGSGIGRTLLQKTYDYAKSNGIKTVKLICFTNNTNAMGLYKSEGFGDYESTLIKTLS